MWQPIECDICGTADIEEQVWLCIDGIYRCMDCLDMFGRCTDQVTRHEKKLIKEFEESQLAYA